MILNAISIAGSTQIVTLVRLLNVPDRKLRVVVDDVIPADRHRALHLGPCQRWLRATNVSAIVGCKAN